ncbi:MAG: dihydrodipicolinate synthase family protein [Niabella sp.]
MRTTGIIAATFSTFDDKGNLDLQLISTIVEKLVAEGVTGVFVCGTNGEGLSLSIEERKLIAEAYIRAAKKRIKVFVHVGHSSVTEARKLAAHAAEAGADAVSAVAAFYFKPSSVSSLVDCMATIAGGAPGVPFYYYHMPAITGVNIDVLQFLKQGAEKIPTLAGVKYTANTLHEFQRCLHYAGDRFDVLFGYDELLLPALSVGARGAVGSTYSFAAPMYIKIIELFREGKINEAEDWQYRCVQMIGGLAKYSPIPAQKAILKMLGTDLGGCRLPLRGLAKEEFRELRQYLEQVHFFSDLEEAVTTRQKVHTAADALATQRS